MWVRIRAGTGLPLVLHLAGEVAVLALATASCHAQEPILLPGHEVVAKLTECCHPADSVAFSPDGKVLAFATDNDHGAGVEAVTLIDARTRKVSRVFEGERREDHDRSVLSLAVTPDRALVAAAIEDSANVGSLRPKGDVVVWEAATGRVVAEFPAVVMGPASVAVSPDGATLAYVGPDNSIRLWDIAARRERARMPGSTAGNLSRIEGVAFAPDGRTLASAENYATFFCRLKFWDVATGRERRAVPLKGRIIWSLAYAADGATLTTAESIVDVEAEEERVGIALRDGATGQERAFLSDDRGRDGPRDHALRDLAVSPDGRTLAVCDGFDRLRLWDPVGRRIRTTLEGPPAMAQCLAFSPDGTKLASAGIRGAYLWDVPGLLAHTDADGHIYPVRAVAFSGDGRTLASAGNDEVIHLWDVEGRRVRASLRREYLGEVDRLALSPDGRSLASVDDSGGVVLWDVATRKDTATFQGVRSAAFSPDGRTLALAGGEDIDDHGRPGHVILYDVAGGRERARLAGAPSSLFAVAYAPDGRTVAAGGFDAAVRLWDPDTREVRLVLNGHEEEVRVLAFSPDGTVLASGSDDETVKLWDVATGRERRTLRGFEGAVNVLAFSPDGATLAIARRDGSVVLLDPATGQEKRTVRGEGPARSLAFSPDGRHLATVGADTSIRLWDVTGPGARSR